MMTVGIDITLFLFYLDLPFDFAHKFYIKSHSLCQKDLSEWDIQGLGHLGEAFGDKQGVGHSTLSVLKSDE